MKPFLISNSDCNCRYKQRKKQKLVHEQVNQQRIQIGSISNFAGHGILIKFKTPSHLPRTGVKTNLHYPLLTPGQHPYPPGDPLKCMLFD